MNVCVYVCVYMCIYVCMCDGCFFLSIQNQATSPLHSHISSKRPSSFRIRNDTGCLLRYWTSSATTCADAELDDIITTRPAVMSSTPLAQEAFLDAPLSSSSSSSSSAGV